MNDVSIAWAVGAGVFGAVLGFVAGYLLGLRIGYLAGLKVSARMAVAKIRRR